MSEVLPGAVLFDMDGLLVETESLWFRAESELVAGMGGQWSDADSADMVGGPLERAVRAMIEVAGGDHDEVVVRDRLLSRMEQLLRTEPVHWLPGARELLIALRDSDVPCALVSASWRSLVDAVLDAVLHDVGADALQTTVAGDDLPRTKPHPDPYLEAARRLGVPPQRCVVLEDSITGSDAGAAAGALVVAVPTHAAVLPRPGVRVVDSLLGLSPTSLGEWSEHWANQQDAVT
jgi:HAD superfamily hydrolase (TIGR01509 family)